MKKVLLALALAATCAAPLAAAPRGVVAELFTATWWSFCPWADEALGKIADEKGLKNWVPVAWHSSGSDPYYTKEAGGRMSYYGVGGWPTCVFDGVDRIVGGTSGTYDEYLNAYNNRRNNPSPLTVEFLANSYAGDHASVKVKVKLEKSLGEGHLCYIALWEDKVAGNYRFVERSLAPYEVITITKANEEQVIKRTFALGRGWNKANLGVSAFVQKLVGKQVLNGRAAKLVAGNAVEPSSLGRVKALFN